MIKQVYLTIENDSDLTLRIKHIQCNLLDKLSKLKKISFNRIDIKLQANSNDTKRFNIDYNDDKFLGITLFLSRGITNNIIHPDSILEIYKILFDSFQIVWTNNGWDVSGLRERYDLIVKENYQVDILYATPILSLNKKYKFNFGCVVNPQSGKYFIQYPDFHYKKKKVRVYFFEGMPDVVVFYLFFSSIRWKSENIVCLLALNLEVGFKFDLRNATFDIYMEPKENDEKLLYEYLAAFAADKTVSQRNALLGISV